MRRNGRASAFWSSEIVLAAEESERFRLAAGAMKHSRQEADGLDAAAALKAAGEFLSAAWAAFPVPETTAGRLAACYHRAVLHMLPGTAWADRLKAGQAIGRVDHFLTLDRGRNAPGPILKNFITAGPWMGRNTGSGLMGRLRERYGPILLYVAEQALAEFTAASPEAKLDALLEMEDFPYQELITQSLGYVWSVIYVPRAIRRSLRFLAELNPRDEYPEARAMKRHFVLHIGGTNTGKTYAGFQRLRQVKTGVYLAPLRLLALEAQELLLDYGVACSLTTGEEEDRQEGDTHIAATAEKLELTRRYDAAVIDECQMIADPERGFAWTRAILGILAPEVHLCAAPEAKNLLLALVKSCGDSFEVIEHRRKTPLVCMKRVVDYASVQPGDALITFSKVGVLSVAEDLRARGKEPAIIYGALPYATRRKQVEGFLNGDMEYVVSTDAIGMGLNLPIRRIIFMETEKFDGRERRSLKPEEIQQIAGRAGRYGMYDKGFVGAMENLSYIRAGLETVVPPLRHAVVGFSDLVITVDFDLLEVLEVWSSMPTPDPYVKLDVSRYISLIGRMRQAGFRLTKELELRAANIPFDETDPELAALFFRFLRLWQEGEAVERPALGEKQTAFTLPELELYCRKLDLYFSFCKAFQCPVDRDGLYDERERIADEINQILLHNLKNNIRFCAKCGAALPLHHAGRLCNNCFRSLRGGAAAKHRHR
jgi:ATP-dependent RNA helicase SUPV3L1/SUV3